MNQLKKLHAHTLRNGLDFTKFLIEKLLEIPNIPYAHKLFDNIPNPTIFLYNKLSQASHGPHDHCLSLYIQMCRQGFSPNALSFTLLFVACTKLSSPRQGQMLHADFIKHGFQFDLFALTALVDMYAKMGSVHLARKQFDEMKIRDVPTWNSLITGYVKSGNMEEALHLFSTMPSRNVISWTAMISGYTQNGQYGSALAIYRELEKENGVKPNQVTIASVLPACANLGALEFGQKIEAYARANGYFKNMFVCNAVLEMYAKCGKLDAAMEVFVEIGKRRNLCSWNTMIMGLAIHGKSNEALDLFDQMLVNSLIYYLCYFMMKSQPRLNYTWILANSTCPLCSSSFPEGFSFDEPRNQWDCFLEDRRREDLSRLNRESGEISRCNLDARLCFSTGSCQYVVWDSELQVSLPSANGCTARNPKFLKGNHHAEGESFSDLYPRFGCGPPRKVNFQVAQIPMLLELLSIILACPLPTQLN